MRLLTAATGAALLLLAASPAFAGGPTGGGGHPPRPGPCCGHGGGNTNVNVNVNAHATASASASAQSYLHARAYEVGSYRSGYSGGGVFYTGGGYGGDGGGYTGLPVYYDLPVSGGACASAPFGYVVTGFGRDGRRPVRCAGYRREDHDRGGRYGYSERHESYEESRYESYEAYEEYEARSSYGEATISAYEQGYIDGRIGCDCQRDREPAPYPPAYLPEPPRYDPPRARPERPAPPRRRAPARQEYRQEPGERG
jgi:hypothetical protein